MRSIFKEFTRADAIKAQEDRERLRRAALESQRNLENATATQFPGEGCDSCLYCTKSVSTANQKDLCSDSFVYLPIYMDIINQRPAWCPGFFRCQITQITIASVSFPLTHEQHEIEGQQELPL
jgi:hypothetical protein